MRPCSYVVPHDFGLAPNPFYGYCTLAVCTPNHQGIRAKKGDWFMGTQSVSKGSKLIYAMEVSEVLSFDDYYHDPRFEQKKPVKRGSQREQVGDNMYYQDQNGVWQQHPTYNHTQQVAQDTKHPRVFIAKHFYYFGENAVEIPFNYQNLIRRRQGCKCSHDPQVVADFLNWLAKSYQPGVHGEPGSWDKNNGSSIELNF